MTREEIIAKYPPRKLANQAEFDRFMCELNAEQTHLNHPIYDQEREIRAKKEDIKIQIEKLRITMSELGKEILELEQQRKDLNRTFYDIKHELIQLNPIDGWVKEEEEE